MPLGILKNITITNKGIVMIITLENIEESGLIINYMKKVNTGFGFRNQLVYFKETHCMNCKTLVVIIYNKTFKGISSNGGFFQRSRITGEPIIACSEDCVKEIKKRIKEENK